MSSLVLGEIRLAESEGEQSVEGAMLDVASALAALGRNVRFVCQNPEKEAAHALQERASSAGFDVNVRGEESSQPPLPFPSAPQDGARLLDLQLFDPRVLIFGGSAIHAPQPASAVVQWAQAASSMATLVYVPLISRPPNGNLNRLRRQTDKFIQIADVVYATASDIRLLYGITGSDRAYNRIAQYWFENGVSIVAITLDSNDTLMYSRSGGGVKIFAPQPRDYAEASAPDRQASAPGKASVSGGASASRKVATPGDPSASAESSIAGKTVASGESSVAGKAVVSGKAAAEFAAGLCDALDRVTLLGASERPRLADASTTLLYTTGSFAGAAATLAEREAGFPNRDAITEFVNRIH